MEDPVAISSDDEIAPKETAIRKLEIYYPKGHLKPVKILHDDLRRLNNEEDLNDTIIDFYLRYLTVDRSDVHVFTSFFYSTLKIPRERSEESEEESEQEIQAADVQIDYEKVKRWTRSVDIFAKRIWLVPIAENEHWTLMIVANPASVFSDKDSTRDSQTPSDASNTNGSAENNTKKELSYEEQPSMFYFDSLGIENLEATYVIEKYIYQEWINKKGCTSVKQEDVFLPNFTPHLPLQENVYDCGVYLLHYAELFLKSTEISIFRNKDLSTWFNASVITSKRYMIKNILHQLFQKEEEYDRKCTYVIFKLKRPRRRRKMNQRYMDIPKKKPKLMDSSDGLSS